MNEFCEYLAHYGIKGQKKGVRRYQYEDGSLTPEGKERYGIKDDKKYIQFSKIKPDWKVFHINNERQLKRSLGTVYDNGRHISLIDKTTGREATYLPYFKEMITPVLQSDSKNIVLERGSFMFSNRKEMNRFLRKPAKYLVENTGVSSNGEKEYDVVSKKDLRRRNKKSEIQNKK